MSTNGVLQHPKSFEEHLVDDSDDILHHIGFSRKGDDLPKMFCDVKFVCSGGSATRIKEYAKLFAMKLGVLVQDMSRTDRYSMWKTGPVIWVNHGIGVPSCLICLNEVFKLLRYAGAKEYKCFRLGTSGGVGIDPGSVVISKGTLNEQLKPAFVHYVGGKMVEREATLDPDLSEELFLTAKKLGIPVEKGITMCANDFYEGQMRLDGLFCAYSEEEKFEFLLKIKDLGVKNIEMECTGFASFTKRAGVPSAIVCVVLVNRFCGDQIRLAKDAYHAYEQRPFETISTYILRSLSKLQLMTIDDYI